MKYEETFLDDFSASFCQYLLNAEIVGFIAIAACIYGFKLRYLLSVRNVVAIMSKFIVTLMSTITITIDSTKLIVHSNHNFITKIIPTFNY